MTAPIVPMFAPTPSEARVVVPERRSFERTLDRAERGAGRRTQRRDGDDGAHRSETPSRPERPDRPDTDDRVESADRPDTDARAESAERAEPTDEVDAERPIDAVAEEERTTDLDHSSTDSEQAAAAVDLGGARAADLGDGAAPSETGEDDLAALLGLAQGPVAPTPTAAEATGDVAAVTTEDGAVAPAAPAPEVGAELGEAAEVLAGEQPTATEIPTESTEAPPTSTAEELVGETAETPETPAEVSIGADVDAGPVDAANEDAAESSAAEDAGSPVGDDPQAGDPGTGTETTPDHTAGERPSGDDAAGPPVDDGAPAPAPVPAPTQAANADQAATNGPRVETGVAATAPAGNAASSPHAPAAPTPTTMASTVQRIMEVVEEINRQTPARSMTIELSELDGVRVQVSMEGGAVRLRFLDDLPQDQRRLLEREMERSLADRGLDLHQESGGRRRPDHEQTEPTWVPLDSGRVLRPSMSPRQPADAERGVRL